MVDDKISCADGIWIRMILRVSLIWYGGNWLGTSLREFIIQNDGATVGTKYCTRNTVTTVINNYKKKNKLENNNRKELHRNYEITPSENVYQLMCLMLQPYAHYWNIMTVKGGDKIVN